jgi:hypothetical protein
MVTREREGTRKIFGRGWRLGRVETMAGSGFSLARPLVAADNNLCPVSGKAAALDLRSFPVTEPITHKPEHPAPPLAPRPPWRKRYRWVLYLFVAAVLVLAIYVGWAIIHAWMEYVNELTEF